MSDNAQAKAKKVLFLKMPSFTRFLIGGLAAYWLSTIMNPAFVAIAVLIILIIPVLTVDNMFSRQFERAYRQPEGIKPKVISKSEYLASLEASAKTEKKSEPEPPKQEKGNKSKSKSKH